MDDNVRYYSVSEIVKMRLPGIPTTRQGVDTLVKRDKWPFREAKGLGGPGGVRREYQPPPAIQKLIDDRQRGELAAAPKAPVSNALVAESTVPPEYHAPTAEPPWINIEALTQAILSMQQLRPNESLAEQIKKGVEFYRYCVIKGLVTRDGTGSGDLKGAV